MSDSAVTVIVAGVVQVVVLVVGWLTLWTRLRYGVERTEAVEKKLDDNTATTNSVDSKADTIVSQTNGVLSGLGESVKRLDERVVALEKYNRDTAHKLADILNGANAKLEVLVALAPKPAVLATPPPVAKEGG